MSIHVAVGGLMAWKVRKSRVGVSKAKIQWDKVMKNSVYVKQKILGLVGGSLTGQSSRAL